MRCNRLALIAVLTASSLAHAGFSFEVESSADTPNINGIQILPVGRDLVVTNTIAHLAGDPVTPLYLDFGLRFDHADPAGDLFYAPANDVYQLYILPGMLPQTTAIARALFAGESEAISLGGGIYRYHADLVGSDDPARIVAVDTPGTVDLTFNLDLPLGRQVISGTVAFGEPFGDGQVPEPSSVLMLACGVLPALRLARRR